MKYMFGKFKIYFGDVWHIEERNSTFNSSGVCCFVRIDVFYFNESVLNPSCPNSLNPAENTYPMLLKYRLWFLPAAHI